MGTDLLLPSQPWMDCDLWVTLQRVLRQRRALKLASPRRHLQSPLHLCPWPPQASPCFSFHTLPASSTTSITSAPSTSSATSSSAPATSLPSALCTTAVLGLDVLCYVPRRCPLRRAGAALSRGLVRQAHAAQRVLEQQGQVVPVGAASSTSISYTSYQCGGAGQWLPSVVMVVWPVAGAHRC